MELNPVEFRDTLHKIPFAEDSWNDLISLIKVSTDSQAGIMMITRDQDHDILNSHSPDFVMSQEVRCAFEESEWITAAMPEEWSKQYLSKGVVLGTDIVSQEKMRSTPFYQEILSTLGLEYLMAGVSLFGEDYRALLKFFRADKQNNFSHGEAQALAELMPEIRQMMRFTERLYERMVLETAESKVDAPRGAATIIINTSGEVVQTNQVAQNLLNKGNILDAKQNHLYAVDGQDSIALSTLMAKALGNTGQPTQGCALVGEASEAGVHQLLALPIPLQEPPFPWMEALKVAAVVVVDPMRKVKIDAHILKTLYSITPAEIDLVNAMANGIKPVQYATQVNKSVPTVQSQRQAVFQKVGVKNQLELMNILRDLTTSFEEIYA
ncbi:MAG: helix-turn-helix transcriptional regulator [Thiohalomonadales bacterium]